ncbi:MAG: hypothetical protein JXM69_14510 [Anaerolineae bacterium]|nr:hypothetical protein [Anaerolineae bacterium]
MAAEIKTVIGQLSIAGGSWRGDAPNQVAVREPKSADAPGAGKGDLFVLTEARGPVSNRDDLEQQLAETIRDAYYLARGSITASLRRALQAASDQLYRHNHQARADQRVVAGVVAVVVRDKDAFVAQIGPAAMFALLSGYIRRYPTHSTWLDDALAPKHDAPALGARAVVEPNLHHLRVSPNDMLILADSRLAGQLPLDDVLRSADPHHVKATVKRLGKVAQASNCSALVLSIAEAEPSAFDVLKQNTPGVLKKGAPAQLSRFFGRRQAATATPTMPVAEAIIEPRPVSEPMAATLFPNRSAKAQPQTAPVGRKPKTRNGQPPAQSMESEAQFSQDESIPETYYDLDYRLGQDARVMASVAQEANYRPQWRRRQPSPASMILRWIGTSLLILVTLLGTGLKNILALVLPRSGGYPSRQAGAHVYRHQSSPIPWTLLRNIAIALPFLVAIVVGVRYLQKGRMIEAEYTGFVTTAQNKFQQAQAIATTDPGTAVSLMEEAETALVEAETIKVGQPEIAELRQQMATMADEVGNVQRLYYMPQLYQYADAGTKLKRIVVQGVEVYVLDSGSDRIFHHQLDDLGEALLPNDEETLVLTSRGQAVEGVTVADLLDMVWMPAGGNRQTSDLVILNTTGLLEFDPNWDITTAALAGGELMTLPVAVSSYFGNFYILDPQANRLLRYLPTTDGYSAPPENYFPDDQPVDLSKAVDLAIDGAVYVLFGDGRLSKFEGGQPVEFNMSGLDRPFKNPISVFTAPDEEVQYLYVADAGNRRIVQLEKDGRFVRQFKPREGEAVSFADLQDIYVDELGGRLYILDSNNLYLANIPRQGAE